MKKNYLNKFALLTITLTMIILLNPIKASAEWKQDDTGWWYTEGNSFVTGWMEIDGTWYYFKEDGYMAHDTTIDGYVIGSDGGWIQSISKNDTVTQENQDSNSGSFNINVNIKYNIYLADKVKQTDSNIIEATKEALFDMGCDLAKMQHYNMYSTNTDVLIFDVKETGTDNWEVYLHLKDQKEKEYNTNTALTAIVSKEKNGEYKGGFKYSAPAEGKTISKTKLD